MHLKDFFSKRLSLSAIRSWRTSCAWIIAPLLIGIAGVSMAKISQLCASINLWITTQTGFAPLFYMPAGYALMIYVSRRYFPGTQGSGIPQAIAVINDPDNIKKNNFLSVRILFGRVLLLIAGLIMGASIGHEGPMVQIGASIMHAFYGYGTVRTSDQRRMLVLSGGAAGIAATFNTPLGGLLFAMEELPKKYVFNAFSSAFLTVILSGLVSLVLLGQYTYFGNYGETLPLMPYLRSILLCAAIGGIFGGLFSMIAQKFPHNLPQKIKSAFDSRPFIFAAVCGFIVACLGLFTDGLTFCTGYLPTRTILDADGATYVWYYGLSKWLATLMSAICGLPGGLFAPTLSVGVGLGDGFYQFFSEWAPHRAFVILVMAAYLSGMTQSPITASVLTIEITGSHEMLFPLMIASLVAYFISKLICPTSFYHTLAERMSLAQINQNTSNNSPPK